MESETQCILLSHLHLNHIIFGHYWCNFTCGKYLDVIAMSGQQLKKHFLKCPGISDACRKPSSQGSASDGSQSGGKQLKMSHSRDSGPQTKKDKGDQCSQEGKHDEKHSLKTDSKSQSVHLAESSTTG